MGLQSVRFQPYRLARSRCWSPRDARIQCTACHDPHQPLVREAAAYDSNCLACHSKAGASTRSAAAGRVCPVNTRDCVGCHMPKIQLAGNALTFTDHMIRVRRPGSGLSDWPSSPLKKCCGPRRKGGASAPHKARPNIFNNLSSGRRRGGTGSPALPRAWTGFLSAC